MNIYERCRLKFLPPYGPMLTKTKKKKIEILQFFE